MADSADNTPLLFLVTGSRGAGKTTFCGKLVQEARDAGWRVAGIVSPAVFDGSQRSAIDAEDLATGEKRRLAARSDSPTPGTKHWAFDPAVIEWGNQVLQASVPCDLLIVDELGPLEFERGVGWQAGITALDSRKYAIAVVVVRSEMLSEGLLRWQDANLIEIDTPEDSAYKARILSEQLF